jgi:hypothetical protein
MVKCQDARAQGGQAHHQEGSVRHTASTPAGPGLTPAWAAAGVAAGCDQHGFVGQFSAEHLMHVAAGTRSSRASDSAHSRSSAGLPLNRDSGSAYPGQYQSAEDVVDSDHGDGSQLAWRGAPLGYLESSGQAASAGHRSVSVHSGNVYSSGGDVSSSGSASGIVVQGSALTTGISRGSNVLLGSASKPGSSKLHKTVTYRRQGQVPTHRQIANVLWALPWLVDKGKRHVLGAGCQQELRALERASLSFFPSPPAMPARPLQHMGTQGTNSQGRSAWAAATQVTGVPPGDLQRPNGSSGQGSASSAAGQQLQQVDAWESRQQQQQHLHHQAQDRPYPQQPATPAIPASELVQVSTAFAALGYMPSPEYLAAHQWQAALSWHQLEPVQRRRLARTYVLLGRRGPSRAALQGLTAACGDAPCCVVPEPVEMSSQPGDRDKEQASAGAPQVLHRRRSGSGAQLWQRPVVSSIVPLRLRRRRGSGSDAQGCVGEGCAV